MVARKYSSLVSFLPILTMYVGPAYSDGRSFNVSGYLKSDLMYSSYSGTPTATAPGEDLLIASTISTSGQKDNPRMNFHVKESRFKFDWQDKNTSLQPSVRLALDFMYSAQGNEIVSNSYSPRIRQFYVKTNNGWLIGQEFSNFMDFASYPELNDFGGPVGKLLSMQPQIRYTFKGWGGSVLSLSAENANTTFVETTALPTESRKELFPDFTFKYSHLYKKTKFAISALTRNLQTQTSNNRKRTGALSVSISHNFSLDKLTFLYTFGTAGRYTTLIPDVYENSVNDIKSIKSRGGFISYKHYWLENKLYSTIVASKLTASNVSQSSINLAKDYKSMHANIMYRHNAFRTGAEYIYAKRKNESGDYGALKRFQFSVRYNFT